MKLYKYTFGDWEKYGPAIDEADAYERRISIDPQFHYIPVMIEEVRLEGHEIIVQPITEEIRNEPGEEFTFVPFTATHPSALNKEQLKKWLTMKQIPFHHTLGEVKLRELALSHV